jgi:membrane-bound inhibitor of C-type lysozyme
MEFNKVTRFSMITAIVLYVAVFAAGFFLGKYYQSVQSVTNPKEGAVSFVCDGNKIINVVFFTDRVALSLSDGKGLVLPQESISGATAKYTDGSIIFWNEGERGV